MLIVVVLIAQARLLYIFPQPDGARWWGDETGQMLELRTELQYGYARIPTALGSSLAITNGLVRGNSWLAAALYGLPTLLFSNVADVVTIGRTITFALSIILLLLMYRMLMASQVPRVLSLFAVLLLVTTRSFFFASHAARLDVVAAIGLLAFVWYLSKHYDALRQMLWRPTAFWYFGYGAAAMLFVSLSIHLLTLLGLLSLYMLRQFGAFRKLSSIASAVGGVVMMIGLFIGIYAISGASFSLYSPSSVPNQFQSVAAELPILRPFSRSVQVANILERLHGLWLEAPAFLILVCFAIGLIIAKRSPALRSNRDGWVSGAAIVIAIAWLLFQSPALYYYVQVLPLFIIAIVVGLSRRFALPPIAYIAIGAISVALSYLGIVDTTRAERVSFAIASGNYVALEQVLDTIRIATRPNERPVVLAQNPAIATLEHEKGIRLMTAHFISFPISNQSVANVLQKHHVQYLLLYASHDGSSYSADYHALRPIADSLGTIIFRLPGMLFDVHRDYFTSYALNDDVSMDTLILYKLPTFAR